MGALAPHACPQTGADGARPGTVGRPKIWRGTGARNWKGAQEMTFAPHQRHAAVHRALRSPGKSLDSKTRTFFEPRMGHDFSRVRVHSDTEAAASARAVSAQAYTVGQHVAFDSGKYQPHTAQGHQLIAHE